MPEEQIKSMVIVKKAAALVNSDQGKLDPRYKAAIVTACDKILAGGYEDQFPLTVYQTGSGTQTNMNVKDRKSTRLNSSHVSISYAVFCLIKKHTNTRTGG